MKATSIAAVALLALFASQAQAQKMTGISVDKAQAQAGQPVTATVALETADNLAHCGLMINWGDGATEDIKIFKMEHVPVVRQHTYAKPGSYNITAEAKKVTSHLGCQGKKVSAKVDVAAAAKAAAAPAATATAAKPASHCPDGWKLDAKSVNKKTGAFTCKAKVGTPLPEKKLECAGETGYFENAKKGQIGCRV